MRRRIAVAVFAGAILVSGCSQIDSLDPGQVFNHFPIATLTIAVGDVLVAESVPILVAPTCTQGPTSFTCNGTTIADEAITVSASITEPQVMTIQVGAQVIYDGSVQDVLDAASQVAP
ncbi:MAG: hypothetical protein O2943_08370 [Actinomycetota bacterium]|nr:hypothetical protein [Actinomycetota bacterium]